jgi:hypothetical protein
MQQVKRSIAPLALVAALALAATASAGSVYVGSGTEDPRVDVYFGVKKKPGKPRKVRRFTAVNIPTTCSDGSTHRTDPALPIEFPRPMKVIERRFAGKERFTVESTKGDWRITMRVTGKLRRGGRARGILKIRGRPRSDVSCRSGKVPWRAARVEKG